MQRNSFKKVLKEFRSEQICTHPVRRLQFCLQHGYPSETVRQTSAAVTRLITFAKMNGIVSSTFILNTRTPQGCVLSPLLYSLFTNDCVSHHSSVQRLKFTDDTTLEGLVTNSDESKYRHGVNRCRDVIITTFT